MSTMAASSQDSQPFHWHYTELDDRNFQVHGRSLILILILLALLLLFTLLCLYARWLCRYRQLINYSTSATTTTTTTTIQNPPNNNSVASGGLDRATINRLPIILHRSTAPDEAAAAATQCSICLTTLEEEEKVKVLPDCNHSYHPECVDRWLITHSNCPLCRASLRVLHHSPDLP